MKLVKSLIAGAALLVASQAPAYEITIGGVTWEPDWLTPGTALGDGDFVASGGFTQWFSSTNTTGALDFSSKQALSDVGIGSFLSGVGELSLVQGGTDFCSGCELTYAYGGFEVNGINTFDVSNAWINFYVTEDSAVDFNYLNVLGSGQTEIDKAFAASTWLELAIASAELQSVTLFEGTLVSQGYVTGGLAELNFDNDYFGGIVDALATGITIGSFNQQTGLAIGSMNVLADTVPVPAPLALLGLGLVALGLRARKAA